MKTDLSFLPEEKQQELRELIAYIRKTPYFQAIKMIILFGSYARNTWVEDRYQERDGSTAEYRSDYDILIVTHSEEEATYKQYEIRLMNHVDEMRTISTPVNVISHGIDYLNDEIRDNNYFFTDIVREGVMLFDGNTFALAEPGTLDPQRRLEKATLTFPKMLKNGDMFYNNFLSNLQTGEEDADYYNIAIFLLHQAAEEYYKTAELVLTDYKSRTHSIRRLHYYACFRDERFRTVFLFSSEESKMRFKVLEKAYVDARYKTGYTVDKATLEYLGERVQILRSVVEMVCRDQLAELAIAAQECFGNQA